MLRTDRVGGGMDGDGVAVRAPAGHDEAGKKPLRCERRAIAVCGIVQGVGFRPFVYALAQACGIGGLVRNDGEGVYIEAEAPVERLDAFVARLAAESPPLAVVEAISWQPLAPSGERAFRIDRSAEAVQRRTLVSPDVATCYACLRELFDPADRRYRYPFINCTNCGPRFTITCSIPYDRDTTTMAGFRMCPACRCEYDDPADRRFHAQPNACPVCGPRARLLDRAGTRVAADDPVRRTAELLRGGAIVAIKGLGGYHLACDPFNAEAVDALRGRKARQDKPFALMARDLAQARLLCNVNPTEEALLTSPARSIVLLKFNVQRSTFNVQRSDSMASPDGSCVRSRSRDAERRTQNAEPGTVLSELRTQNSELAPGVAPRQNRLGIMLAYTPLHHLLLHDVEAPLVMTSGNRSDEPIAYRDEEALDQLGPIADYFLVHDRPIHMRCDDSVMRVWSGHSFPVRRSRGYAPAPLRLGRELRRHILACGGELKNTFCLARGRHAFLSHHIGDLENYETLRSFREGIEHYCRLFDVQPQVVAYDLHPEYLSTKYARELEEDGLPAIGVQHHHAHIAACLADNERPADERVIGVSFDGTGYGTDGAIWGGEFLVGSIQAGFERRGHLDYVPLPGGAAAIRQPWRMAVAHLIAAYGDEVSALPAGFVRRLGEGNVHAVAQLVRAGINSPMTSSAGRLFDAIAALLDLPGTDRATYEGQAAVELELAARGQGDRSYPASIVQRSTFNVQRGTPAGYMPTSRQPHLGEQSPVEQGGRGANWVVDTQAIIRSVVDDLRSGRDTNEIAACFHRTMAEVILAGCRRVCDEDGVRAVALSGGVFQNTRLLDETASLLTTAGFTVYVHRRVPTNDGGLSLGQAVLADAEGFKFQVLGFT